MPSPQPRLGEVPRTIAGIGERRGGAAPGEEDNVRPSLGPADPRGTVGIAVGFLFAAVRQAGLACLPHTPSPMDFLTEELDRPDNERAYLVVPIGYPAEGCQVPAIDKKPLEETAVWR